jgi:hypothetical protein
VTDRFPRVLLATFLALHALAHLTGAFVDWGLADGERAERSTTVIGGLDVGSTGIRVLGGLAVVATLAFLVAVLGIVREERWEVMAIVAAAAFSAAVCAVQIELAWVGLVLDVAILAGVVWWRRRSDPLRTLPRPTR